LLLDERFDLIAQLLLARGAPVDVVAVEESTGIPAA
jgi:hypothetical protein